MKKNQKQNQLPLRGAIIGFGNVAIYGHLPIWQKDDRFRIDAILEPEPERANLARNLLPESHVYSDLESLLAEERLDFVDICTPPCFHADLILKALRAGLHVFCEKPLVTSFESLREIYQAASDVGRVVFSVNNWKYAPQWMKTIELVHIKGIGRVRSVSLTVLRPPGSGGGVSNWRRCVQVAGGGILLDHGWHQLYLLLSTIGESPLAVTASLEYAQGTEHQLDEIVDLVILFPTGEAKLRLNGRASCRRNEGLIIGDKGTLFINDDHILEKQGSKMVRYDFPEPLSGGSHHPEWMRPVTEDFLHEVLDLKAPRANLMEAMWCAQLIHLAYQSHLEGSRFIPVENFTV